jgi:hypothetical protein
MKENEHVKNQVIFITNSVYDKLHSTSMYEPEENPISEQIHKEHDND